MDKKAPYPAQQAAYPVQRAAYPMQAQPYLMQQQVPYGGQPGLYVQQQQQYPSYAVAGAYNGMPPPPYSGPPPPYQAPMQTSYVAPAPVVYGGAFDAGARFGVGSSVSVPPPPPGYMPTAVQMASAHGQPVVMRQDQAGYFMGGSNGGVSMNF